MTPLNARKSTLPGMAQRSWIDRIVRPFTMGLAILLLVTVVETTVPQVSLSVRSPEQHQAVASTHPSIQVEVGQVEAGAHFNQRRLTEAAMTGHNLTSARFFSHRNGTKPSIEASNALKKLNNSHI